MATEVVAFLTEAVDNETRDSTISLKVAYTTALADFQNAKASDHF